MVRFTTEQLHAAMSLPTNIRNMSIIAHVDHGKCFRRGTIIPLINGGNEVVEKLCVGQEILGDDFKPRKILEVHRGKGLMYEIQQKVGDPYYVNGNHILCLRTADDYATIEISVNDFIELPIDFRTYYKGYKVRPYIKYDIVVKPLEIEDYYGFTVDGNSRFLLSDFTVTHNSTISDSLLNKAGIISDEATGLKRGTDTRKDEIERGIT